jgi:hypothetical protein
MKELHYQAIGSTTGWALPTLLGITKTGGRILLHLWNWSYDGKAWQGVLALQNHVAALHEEVDTL